MNKAKLALEAVLLFHSGGPWTSDKAKRWGEILNDTLGPSNSRNPSIVGANGDGTWDGARPGNEATTKNLCNMVRAALKEEA